jgi:YggT family protein
MHPSLILWILSALVELLALYSWIIVIAVVMSWLVAFNIVNIRHPFARGVVRFLDAVTEPVFRPIRRVIPPIGGLDLSPLVVWFVIRFLVEWAIPDIASYLVG